MLAASLRRNRGNRALHDFQQRLLYAFARHIAGDRRVVRFAADFIDFINIDDAALRALDVVICGLQQLEDDVLDILADIARLSQSRCICHRERNVQDARKRLSQQSFTAPRGAEQHNVRFRQFDVLRFCRVIEALIVVVNRHGEHALCGALTNHIIIENVANLLGRWNTVTGLNQRGFVLLADDVHAQFDTFVTDEDGRPCDQLAYFVLALAAKRAVEGIFRIAA